MSLENKRIVFSGFRDEDLKSYIEANGGKVMSSVSAQTNILVVKNIEKLTAKIVQAKEMGVTVLGVDAFIKKYNFAAAVKLTKPVKAANAAKAAKPTKPVKTDKAAKAYAMLYVIDKEYEKDTVSATEAKLNVNLQLGDIVVFGELDGRYNNAFFVEWNSKKTKLILDENPDSSGSGYLTVPRTVSAHIPDVVSHYKKLVTTMLVEPSDMFSYEMTGDNTTISRIFKTASDIQKSGQFEVFTYDEEKQLAVTYNNKTEMFALNVTQAKLEKAFMSSDETYNIAFALSASIGSGDGKNSDTIQVYQPPQIVSLSNVKRMMPSNDWKVVQGKDKNTFSATGPKTQAMKMQQAVADWN